MLIMYDSFTSSNYTLDEVMLASKIVPPVDGTTLINAADGSIMVNPDYYYNQSQINRMISSVFKWMGVVESMQDLPSTNLVVGHTYTVREDDLGNENAEYAWNGDEWEFLGTHVDLSGYALTVDVLELVRVERERALEAESTKLDITAFNEAIRAYGKDYTAFEVFPNDTAIAAGDTDPVTGFKYRIAVPAQMTHRTLLRSCTPIDESDLIIDWGDGSVTIVSELPSSCAKLDDTEYVYKLEHTYEVSDRYIVKIYGTKYFGFTTEWESSRDNLTYNLMSRCIEEDLPISSHVTNHASFAALALRLLKVTASECVLTNAFNLSSFFLGDTNLVQVTGVKNISNACRTTTAFFAECAALTTTDFIIPGMTKDGSNYYVFAWCANLVRDVAKLIPTQGFVGHSISMDHAFTNCKGLTGTVPASKLWENTRITWTNTSQCFAGCSDAIRNQVPTSWGGLNSEIEANIQAHYWDHVQVHDLNTELQSLTGMIAQLRTDVQTVIFIRSGTAQTPEVLTLRADKRYIASAPFTASLPADPTDGQLIQLNVSTGSSNMQVLAPAPATINGSNLPLEVGTTPDGIIVNNAVYTLVYDSVASNWIVL